MRVLRTGKEGRLFAGLFRCLTPGTLDVGGGALPAAAGFGDLSRDFDRPMAELARRAGYELIERATQKDGNLLEVRMTPEWLRARATDEHLHAASAIYQM